MEEETIGQEIIGDFNNMSRADVAEIKNLGADLIDAIHKHGNDPRRTAIATTQIELGVMAGIKSIFS